MSALSEYAEYSTVVRLSGSCVLDVVSLNRC